MLSNEPFTLPQPTASLFLSGLKLQGFLLFTWWATVPAAEKKVVADKYSHYLKGDLATNTFKEYHFKDIKEALEVSNTKATEGKVLLKP